eukprot:1915427-Pleurochrysis_carterae.AAC.2
MLSSLGIPASSAHSLSSAVRGSSPASVVAAAAGRRAQKTARKTRCFAADADKRFVLKGPRPETHGARTESTDRIKAQRACSRDVSLRCRPVSWLTASTATIEHPKLS